MEKKNVKSNVKLDDVEDIKLQPTKYKSIYLTPSDFSIFKDECEYWLKYFGLQQFRMTYTAKESSTNRAEVYVDYEGMCANISLSTTWSDCDYCEKNIRQSAFHEVVDGLLLFNITAFVRMNALDCGEFYGRLHEVVRTLESSVFINDYNRRFNTTNGEKR